MRHFIILVSVFVLLMLLGLLFYSPIKKTFYGLVNKNIADQRNVPPSTTPLHPLSDSLVIPTGMVDIDLRQDFMGWVSKRSSDPSAAAISDKASIEFTKDLCRRKIKPACGFREFNGKFADISDAVVYGVSLLGGKILANLDIDLNSRVNRLGPNEHKLLEFEPAVPTRFIFDDGSLRRYPLLGSNFSRGWGVDPKTKGIVVIIAVESNAEFSVYSAKIFEWLSRINNIRNGPDVIDEEKNKQLVELWNGGRVVEDRNLWWESDVLTIIEP